MLLEDEKEKKKSVVQKIKNKRKIKKILTKYVIRIFYSKRK